MLKSISIEHYKGFFDKQTIDLAIPNGTAGSGMTIVVGSNNSGKTSILESIKILSAPDPQVDTEFRHDGHQICIGAVSADDRSLTARNPDFGSTIVFDGNRDVIQLQNLRYVPSRRAWKAFTQAAAMEAGNYWANTSNIDKNSIDNYLVSRIAKLSLTEKRHISENLRKIIPKINDWHIDKSRGELYIQYTTNQGASHSSDLFGEGLASIFRIVLAVYDCMQRPGGISQILTIDEPELSLHPQAQKSLVSFISDSAKNLQIVITTHSPYFIRWSDLINGAKICRVSNLPTGIKTSKLSNGIMKKLEGMYDDWQKPNLLDPVAREIFFSESVIYFEGQEDIGLIRKFAEENSLRPLDLFGYGVGGSGNIKHFLQLARDLNIKAYAVYDGDKIDDMNEAKSLFPEFMVECLPVADIRDKMKRNDRNKETDEIDKVGIFNNKGVIKEEYRDYLFKLTERIYKYIE